MNPKIVCISILFLFGTNKAVATYMTIHNWEDAFERSIGPYGLLSWIHSLTSQHYPFFYAVSLVTVPTLFVLGYGLIVLVRFLQNRYFSTDAFSNQKQYFTISGLQVFDLLLIALSVSTLLCLTYAHWLWNDFTIRGIASTCIILVFARCLMLMIQGLLKIYHSAKKIFIHRSWRKANE